MSEGGARARVRLLIVDDEAEVRNSVRRGLELLGYEVRTAADGAEGLATAESWRPDVVLMDLAMPKLGGLSAIERLRAWSTAPVIVLSVMGEEQDKVRALETGADDYLTKPFGMQELNARIRAALRRAHQGPAEPVMTFGNVEIDLGGHVVRVGGEEVHLTRIEFALLEQLDLNAGRVLTHRQLLTNVWGPQYDTEAHYLRPVVTALRKKLVPQLIRTEPGVGYRLVPPT